MIVAAGSAERRSAVDERIATTGKAGDDYPLGQLYPSPPLDKSVEREPRQHALSARLRSCHFDLPGRIEHLVSLVCES